MKKLMCAVAAVAAGVAFADSGIASANIVGYSTTALVDGSKATCLSFIQCGVAVEGAKGVYLTQIVPEGADEITADENTVSIQLLGPTGKGVETYTYHRGDRRPYKTEGWYDKYDALVGDEEEGVADVFFAKGTGLWMQGTSELTFKSSGEVLLDTQTFDLVDGNRLVANPFPSAVMLTSITPEGAETITADDNTVSIQLLGPTGKSVETYTYHRGDRRPYKTEGWYDKYDALVGDEEEGVADVSLAAGLSLWTQGTKDLDLQIVTPYEDAE